MQGEARQPLGMTDCELEADRTSRVLDELLQFVYGEGVPPNMASVFLPYEVELMEL